MVPCARLGARVVTDLFKAELATGLGIVLAGLSDAIADFLIHMVGG